MGSASINLFENEWTLTCGSEPDSYGLPDKVKEFPKYKVYNDLLEKHNTHNKCRKYRDDPISVKLPGEVHQHLHKAGIVENNVLYRNEQVEQGWVAF